MATSLYQLTLFSSVVCDTNVHSESKVRPRAVPYNARAQRHEQRECPAPQVRADASCYVRGRFCHRSGACLG